MNSSTCSMIIQNLNPIIQCLSSYCSDQITLATLSWLCSDNSPSLARSLCLLIKIRMICCCHVNTITHLLLWTTCPLSGASSRLTDFSRRRHWLLFSHWIFIELHETFRHADSFTFEEQTCVIYICLLNWIHHVTLTLWIINRYCRPLWRCCLNNIIRRFNSISHWFFAFYTLQKTMISSVQSLFDWSASSHCIETMSLDDINFCCFCCVLPTLIKQILQILQILQ